MRTVRTMKQLALQTAVVAATLSLFACGIGVDQAVRAKVKPPKPAITAGEPLGITVTIQTKDGEVVEAWEGNVSLQIASGPHLDALGGTTVVKAVKGVATFTDATLTKVGAGYMISVKPETVEGGKNIPGATVGPVSVSAGTAASIGVIDQPAKGSPNGILYPYPRVAVVDAHGNVATGAETQITVSLQNNPTGATLSGTLTRQTTDGVAVFDDLRVSTLGTGYTLAFSSTSAQATSAAFDVAMGRLTYTDPPAGGKIRLVKNAASTDSVAVLDVVAGETFTGYSVGFNLPVDARSVRASAPLISNVGGLDPGSAPAAFGGALPTSGRMAGFLSAGVSQKAAGTGAVTTNTEVAAGTVLFTVRLEITETPVFKEVFDGATLGSRYEAAVRDRLGEDVVWGQDFRFGRLAVE